MTYIYCPYQRTSCCKPSLSPLCTYIGTIPRPCLSICCC